jgi:hypothetical protein
MIYPGDTSNVVLSITRSDGTAPVTTVSPVVSIVRLVDGVVVVNSQAMTLLAGTQAVWVYPWNTAGALNGNYVTIVSYASDGLTISGRLLSTLTLGDSRITGAVALDSTVAKDATVAKDSTVAHFTDLASVLPDTSPAVLAIKAKTDNLPAAPADAAVLSTVAANVQDLHDFNSGTWTIDKTQNPQVLTILRPSGAVFLKLQLTDSSSATVRMPTS